MTNKANSANPSRLGPDMASTWDQGHGYTQEQQAADDGLMDKFVQYTDSESCSRSLSAPKQNFVDVSLPSRAPAEALIVMSPLPTHQRSSVLEHLAPNLVMDYYDGNTVTGM